MTLNAVLFDIDGTLVDSNDLHVDAWDEVLSEAGHVFDRATLHAHIGQGSDLYVPALLPHLPQAEQEALGTRHGETFKARYLDRVKPFARARDLLARTRVAGLKVVLASSAGGDEIEHYLDLLDARDLVDATTGKDDVGQSKPAPDIFATALSKAGVTAAEAVVVGDTPWDVAAAQRCRLAAIGLRSGGFSDDALAGASAVYDDVAALLAAFEGSPLAA